MKIEFEHFRNHKIGNKFVRNLSRSQINNMGLKYNQTVLPHGGKTVCLIFNDDNTVQYGEVNVWHRDNYCKKTGREYALKRAKKSQPVTPEKLLSMLSVIKETNV